MIKGTFGTPNTTTSRRCVNQSLYTGYQDPGTNIQTASAIGTPIGYGAAQASDLTKLRKRFSRYEYRRYY